MAQPPATAEFRIRITLIAVGTAFLLYGGWKLLHQSIGSLFTAAVWFTVPAVLSDLVLLPVVAVIGGVVTRKLRAWARLPVQVGLALIGFITAIAVPYLTRPGARPDNPSLLDRDYLAGWSIYIGIIVVVMALWAVVRFTRKEPGTVAVTD